MESERSRRALSYSEMLDAALDAAPDQILLSDSTERLARAAVVEAIAAIRGRLAVAGLGGGQLIAVELEPGVQSALHLLAILSHGSAFVPLDPAHGRARVDQLIDLTAPDAIIDGDGLRMRATGPSTPDRGLADIAYVITTSGSTGLPKAVQLGAEGFALHTAAMIDLLGLGHDDVVLATAPPSFDIAVWQQTTPIVAGARTHVVGAGDRADPRALWRIARRERATLLEVVPSMLRLLIDTAPPAETLTLRRVITTGEAIPPALVNRWFEVFPDVPLFNLYGPAECTITATAHRLDGPVDPAHPVPIGEPIAGVLTEVVDKAGRPVDTGVTGELRIIGPTVGHGYLGDPARTAESFGTTVVDGAPLRHYDSGDLVTQGADGVLSFEGRRDHQLQVRGNRVEPGEIEACLVAHPDVTGAVVTAFGDRTGRLAAHVEAPPTIDRLAVRDFVAERLPSYMVPAVIVRYGRLPVTDTGKLDRSSLRAPSDRDHLATGSGAPSTATEQTIAASWRRLLDLDEIPVDADFFDLGGTSLLAVVSLDELSRRLGYELPTEWFTHGTTVASLAAAIDDDRGRQSMTEVGMGLLRVGDAEVGVPLFLHPGEAVSALGMLELARHIGAERPVWVFEPRPPIADEPAPAMHEIASVALDAIRSVRPTGPVHIGGYCMGGDIAWEIATQRAAAGLGTGAVVVIQTEHLAVSTTGHRIADRARHGVDLVTHRLRYEAHQLASLPPHRRRSHVRHLVLGSAAAKVAVPVERWIRRRLGRQRRSAELRRDDWVRADRRAYEDWTPSPGDWPTVVVRSVEQPPHRRGDPTLGWRGATTGALRTRSAPGFHWTVLHRPNVSVLGGVIDQELAELDRAAAAVP